MSKRPRIKQADGSLLDLPLDAETLQGKTLEEIALKTDIPTKTSELTNDSNFLTKHQDISGKADKTELENYLPLSGAKKMTGDLNMDDHDIKNVSTIGVDGTITTATKLLVHDENDDIITNSGWNYNATYYYASGIKFTTAQEQSKYNLYYPKETGTFVVRDDAGGIKSITSIIDPYEKNGIVFGLLNRETTLYNTDSTIGLSSTDMIGEGDIIHSLKFPDTSDGTGDGSWKTYTWNLPKQSGTIALLEDLQGIGGGSGNAPASSGLKLVESGTTMYGDTSIRLEKTPFEKEKVYVISVTLDDGKTSFIVTVDKYGVYTSTTSYFDPLEEWLSLVYANWGDYVLLYVKMLNSQVEAEFGDGTYEIYELAGGTSSAGAKLRKENYISSVESRKRVVDNFNEGTISEDSFIRFTQPVDIVVETPRTRTFKTNTASKPSLYRPIGGQRIFTEREYLTFGDIFRLLFNDFDFSTIDEVYNPSQESLGGRFRHLVFRDSQYSLENRLSSYDVKGYYNSRIMSVFFNSERWTTKQMTFILKPVINYEEIVYSDHTHYTYLTGSHAIEIQIVLSYDNRDDKNPNNYLQYLINYKIVELD